MPNYFRRRIGCFVLAVALQVTGAAPILAQNPPISADARTSDGKIDLEQLRRGARETLDGYAQFDMANARAGEVVRVERQVSAVCKDVAAVSDAVRRQASTFKFEQTGTGRRFPRHTLLYARERSIAAGAKSIEAVDSITLYFDVSRSASACLFTLGVDARVLLQSGPLSGLAPKVVADLLVNETKSLKIAIETLIAGAVGWVSSRPMQLPESGFVSREAIDYLERAGTTDPVLNDLRKSLEDVIAAHTQDSAALKNGVALKFVRYTDPAPLIVRTKLKTDTCRAVPRDLDRPTILCNEKFLYELEFVARTFGPGGLISDEDARTDAGLFKVSAGMRQASALIRNLRAVQQFAPEGVAEATDDRFFSLVLFIIGHELGHLAAYHSVYEFDQTPEKLITSRAIVNLCRQADHFRAHYFQLPGLDPVANRQSEIRSWAQNIRTTVEGADIADAGFLAESLADQYGTGVFLDFLSSAYRKSENDGRRFQAAAVFAVADYALMEWYRRLSDFVEPKCGIPENVSQISLCLAFDADNYVNAFKMYGEVHSAVVARAVLFIAAIIGERTTFYDIPLKQRVVIPSDQMMKGFAPEKMKNMATVAHQLVYHFVMREFLDAPGKIAYLGCASGYRHQTGKGASMIHMRFYSLEEEIRRVFRRITGQ